MVNIDITPEELPGIIGMAEKALGDAPEEARDGVLYKSLLSLTTKLKAGGTAFSLDTEEAMCIVVLNEMILSGAFN